MSLENFKRIVLTKMSLALQPEGFRKKQTWFWHAEDDVVLFVQLQSSSKSTKDALITTVNLGIFSKTVAAAVQNTRKPSIDESHWRQRIGMFMPEERDRWWEIHNDEEAELAGREISEVLSSNVLPEMKSLASTQSLKLLWESGRSPGLTEFQRDQYLKALT